MVKKTFNQTITLRLESWAERVASKADQKIHCNDNLWSALQPSQSSLTTKLLSCLASLFLVHWLTFFLPLPPCNSSAEHPWILITYSQDSRVCFFSVQLKGGFPTTKKSWDWVKSKSVLKLAQIWPQGGMRWLPRVKIHILFSF